MVKEGFMNCSDIDCKKNDGGQCMVDVCLLNESLTIDDKELTTHITKSMNIITNCCKKAKEALSVFKK